jgi:uncharacterized RDD family membrane protein YckC
MIERRAVPANGGSGDHPLWGRRFLVDGVSVAREGILPGQLPRLDRIRQVLAALAAHGVGGDRAAVAVDAVLLGEIDDLGGLLALVREGKVREAPPGGDPVDYLLALAASQEAVVVTCRRQEELRNGRRPAGGRVTVLRPLFLGERVVFARDGEGAAAGLGRRLAALLVDSLILVASGWLLLNMVAAGAVLSLGDGALAARAVGIATLVVAGAAGLYRPLFEAGPWQATPGKRLLGIYVAREGGGRLGLGRALLRELGRAICALTLGAGYLLALADGRRRGLHDRLAGTVVLRGRP